MNRRRGFTMIELLVIVAIVCIIMAIVTRAISQKRECEHNHSDRCKAEVTVKRLRGDGTGLMETVTEICNCIGDH